MRHDRPVIRGAQRPLRYWPIVLIAAALGESVHAPLIPRSTASSIATAAIPRSSIKLAAPPAKESKKLATLTVDPVESFDSESRLRSTEFEIKPFEFPQQPSDVQANLTPEVPVQSFSVGSNLGLPTVEGPDPLVELPPWSHQSEAFSGLAIPNATITQGPVDQQRASVKNSVGVTQVTAVPEPTMVSVLAIGALRLLRRRP